MRRGVRTSIPGSLRCLLLAGVVGCASPSTPRVAPVSLPAYRVQLDRIHTRTDLMAANDPAHQLGITIAVVDLVNRGSSLQAEAVDFRIRLEELTDERGHDLVPYRVDDTRRPFRRPRKGDARPEHRASIRFAGMPRLPLRLAALRGEVEVLLPSTIVVRRVECAPSGRKQIVRGLEFGVERRVDRDYAYEYPLRYRSRVVEADGRPDSPWLHAVDFLDEDDTVLHREYVPRATGSFRDGWRSGRRQVLLPKEYEIATLRLIVVLTRDTVSVPFAWENVRVIGS